MGYQCVDNHHYHLNSEMVFLEILNAKGRAGGSDEPDRVIVTPFYSTAIGVRFIQSRQPLNRPGPDPKPPPNSQPRRIRRVMSGRKKRLHINAAPIFIAVSSKS
jgi:hypothetical protein